MNRILAHLLCIVFGGIGLNAVSSEFCVADEKLNGFLKKAVDYALPRTVKIFGASVGRIEGYGTGILVSDEGHVVTGNGVFLNGFNTRVVLNDGTTLPASVIRRDPSLQLALLKIKASTPDFFQLDEKPAAQKGDWVIAVSNSFKVAERTEPLSVTLGVLSLETHLTAKRRRDEILYDGDLYLIDCITSNPGSAGGAVVTADGKLVGMIGKLIESTETNTRMNYAVPKNLLAKFMAGTLPDKTVESTSEPSGKPAELGIRLFALGGRKSPAFVDRVQRGSPAAKVGIRSDDLVVTLNGKTLANSADFDVAAKSLVPGKMTVIVVKRRNKLLRFEITPIEKK
ncbi:S1C family serine protease [bacterium]|nr:S1C family serine protease [bacterium]